MTTPRLIIDVDKIEHNARTIVALCNQHGIEVTGVTKVTCGHPEVARAMLRGGVSSIADSRLENIQRLIEAFELSQSIYRKDPWAEHAKKAAAYQPLADLTLEAAE